jgi:hypothetical protein
MYPYGQQALAYSWRDRRNLVLALIAVLAAAVATWLRWPVALDGIDDWALRVAFPALLAVVLAFAPRATTRVGRIAKDLTVVGLAAAIFGGDRVPLLVLCYPLLLAVSVALGEFRLGTALWPEDARDAGG